MFYYEIIVNDLSYQRKEPLTYHSAKRLPEGSVVLVPLKQVSVLGFVVRQAAKPRFATKAIEKTFGLTPLPAEIVELAQWLPTYYPAGLGSIGQQFLPKILPAKLPELEAEQPPSTQAAKLPPLTIEQQRVLGQITQPNTYTLHGETGSGKTRVYIELAMRAFREGQSVMVLTPEIALTPQLAENFMAVFGTSVVVTHSHLSMRERTNLWLRMLSSNQPLIVIGPRSALFSPLRKIGLIIVDESHEPSYKQEQSPRYHAVKVAAKLAGLHHASLVLGSATPNVTDYFVATEKRKPILRIEKPARGGYTPPAITLVDLKDRTHFSTKPQLSNELIQAVGNALRAHEQSLLFLNRRGTARVVLCEQCGWQALCTHCNLPLTYHGDSHTLRCHTCGRGWPAPNFCPNCHNSNIILKSAGTKAIFEQISSLFPRTRIQRFDTDNKKSERIEQHYEAVRSGAVDILIGTQLLAKGLDLPNLSVVGVIIADTGLYFPDYSAGERTYQLLRQVIGRVGRGHRNSSVIIQSYDPQNIIIQSAIQNNWPKFYEEQLAERRKFLFPPFCYLLKLTCQRTTSAAAQRAAQSLVESLQRTKLHIQVDGPSPSFHEQSSGKYQWQIVVKARARARLLEVTGQLPSGWSYELDPINLL